MADTSYCQGDDEAASVRVSDSQIVSCGVTADNTAFEKALRAMNLVANNSPLSTDTLNEALDLAACAVNAVGGRAKQDFARIVICRARQCSAERTRLICAILVALYEVCAT